MDLSAELDRILQDIEWEEVVSTLQEILDDTATLPPSQSLLPPPIPAEPELQTFSQPAGSQDGEFTSGCFPVVAAPHVMAASGMYNACQQDIVQPGHLHIPASAYSQEQYLQNQWPQVNMQATATVFGTPDAPPHPFISGVSRVHGNIFENLRCVGMLNGQLLYEHPAGFAPPVAAVPPVTAAPPSVKTSNSKRKRKHDNQQDSDQLYVKKPPNAFMLFMKEQRPNVEATIKSRGSAAVNKFLGESWKALSKEEQAEYYDKAHAEQLLHSQLHPEWSSKDNYGKKRRRQRAKAPAGAAALPLTTEEGAPQAKRQCVTATQPDAVEAPQV